MKLELSTPIFKVRLKVDPLIRTRLNRENINNLERCSREFKGIFRWTPLSTI